MKLINQAVTFLFLSTTTFAIAQAWPTVTEGDKGVVVEVVQHLLRQHGSDVEVNGDFGLSTAQAVSEFQRDRGLADSGTVGAGTWEALVITVKRGDSGEAVKAVQSLSGCYQHALDIDGDFGSGTHRAVLNIQNTLGLTDDGEVDPLTWSTLVSDNQPSTEAPMTTQNTVSFPSGAELSVVTGLPEGCKEPFWDAQQTGNLLLDASGPRDLSLSPNFTLGELAKSGAVEFEIARIDPDLVTCLQAIRDRVEQPVTVNSGYRSWAHNVEVYKERGTQPTLSRHTSGQAADIRSTGLSGEDIAKAAIDVCGCNISVGLAAGYAHVDVRGRWASWSYEKGVDEQLMELRSYHSSVCE